MVDYFTDAVANHPPRIKAFGTPTPLVETSELVNFFCGAEDREDGQTLSISWFKDGTPLAATGSSIQFTAPGDTGVYEISCQVLDSGGLTSSASRPLHVVELNNHAPVIQTLLPAQNFILPNSITTVTCSAVDGDNDQLTYIWTAPDGGSLSETGSMVTWQAPAAAGAYSITCVVEDTHTASDSAEINIVVTDPSGGEMGYPVLFLPFSGNVTDYSGFGNNSLRYGATFVPDRAGNPNAALHFDGVDDKVQVSNSNLLNFTMAISVSLWIKVEEFFGRESYPISHGNWDNRWKISITEQRVRWTVKTSAGVIDLDSDTELLINTYYHVVTLFDGQNLDIYLNGVLDAHTTFSGTINQTDWALTIGQVLPGNPEYNFKGIIDDIRLYDYGLSSEEVGALFVAPVQVDNKNLTGLPDEFFLAPAYPNPFNPSTTISYGLPQATQVILTVHDIRGRQVTVLDNSFKEAGQYSLIWNGLDSSKRLVGTGIYFCRLQAGVKSKTIKLIYLR